MVKLSNQRGHITARFQRGDYQHVLHAFSTSREAFEHKIKHCNQIRGMEDFKAGFSEQVTMKERTCTLTNCLLCSRAWTLLTQLLLHYGMLQVFFVRTIRHKALFGFLDFLFLPKGKYLIWCIIISHCSSVPFSHPCNHLSYVNWTFFSSYPAAEEKTAGGPLAAMPMMFWK